jgi:hypothetical protein
MCRLESPQDYVNAASAPSNQPANEAPDAEVAIYTVVKSMVDPKESQM